MVKRILCVLSLFFATTSFANTYSISGTLPLSNDWSWNSTEEGGHNNYGEIRNIDTYKSTGKTGILLTPDDGYVRTTIYNKNTFSSKSSFSIEAEVLLKSGNNSGADGISLFWVNANSISSTSQLFGGVGEWMGTPSGKALNADNTSRTIGYVTGIQGYAFTFDDYKNKNNISSESNSLIRLSDWNINPKVNLDMSSTPNYFLNSGWTKIKLDYNSDSQVFTYYYIWNGNKFTSSKTWTVAELGDGWYEGYNEAYFGIGAATGGLSGIHAIRNVEFTVPEPATLSLCLFGSVLILFKRNK